MSVLLDLPTLAKLSQTAKVLASRRGLPPVLAHSDVIIPQQSPRPGRCQSLAPTVRHKTICLLNFGFDRSPLFSPFSIHILHSTSKLIRITHRNTNRTFKRYPTLFLYLQPTLTNHHASCRPRNHCRQPRRQQDTGVDDQADGQDPDGWRLERDGRLFSPNEKSMDYS